MCNGVNRIEVKFNLEQAMKARGKGGGLDSGIAVLFL